jgi:hypothetical protein
MFQLRAKLWSVRGWGMLQVWLAMPLLASTEQAGRTLRYSVNVADWVTVPVTLRVAVNAWAPLAAAVAAVEEEEAAPVGAPADEAGVLEAPHAEAQRRSRPPAPPTRRRRTRAEEGMSTRARRFM